MDFDPREFLVDHFMNERVEDQLYDITFGSEEWLQMDAGLLTREEGDRIVAEAMELVGLDPALATRGIDDLSGGQMRRVALAGLLAAHPSVLILDEPMAGLDAASRDLLISVLDERRRAGLSILVISHDLEGMDSLCDTHGHLAEGVLS